MTKINNIFSIIRHSSNVNINVILGVYFLSDLIGSRVRSIRKALNLTQEALAAQLGVSQQHISHIENGTKRASELLVKLLCLLFNTTETWLTTGKGNMFLSDEELVKNQISRLGEHNFAEALNKLLNDDSLEIIRTLLIANSGEKPLEPSLGYMIDFLIELWSLNDEKLKTWAFVQFERAFPEDVKAMVQKKSVRSRIPDYSLPGSQI